MLTPGYAGDASADVLRGLLRASHPFDATDWWLAVIYAYADMAGTRKNRVYVAGCYIGSEEQWAVADTAWKKALEWAKVDHFHATDFYSCWGAFRGWKRGSRRHREAERRFLTIATEANLAGVFTAVETAGLTPEFRAVLDMMKPRYRVQSVRLLCAQLCFVALRDGCRLIPQPHDERISVVFEHEKGIGEVIDNFVASKKRRVAWTQGILSVSSADKKELRPLQFADLLAYESHQYLTHLASQSDAQPQSRLVQLRSGERTIGRFITAENMRDMLPLLREWCKRHPDELTKEARGVFANETCEDP